MHIARLRSGRLWAWVGLALSLMSALASAQSAPAPVIERLEPTSGPPGTLLNVVGRGFVAGASVKLADAELSVERVTPSRIVARVGATSVSGVVSVQTSAGSMRGPEFRVTAPLPLPTLLSVTPAFGPPGTEVTLRGTGFAPGLGRTQVSLSGQPLIVRSVSPNELRVIISDRSTTGPLEINVREAGSVQSPTSFSVTARTEIVRIEPRGVVPGSVVTIVGTGFSPDAANNRVYLNNTRCVVESVTDTSLSVRIPTRAESGRVLLDVRGAGRFESTTELIVQQPPTLVSVTPEKAVAGSVLTLVGTQFGRDASAVELRLGDLALPVREVTPTSLSVELPTGAESGAITLKVHGVGPATLPGAFEVLEPLSLHAFEPRSGPIGTVVTLSGAGFSSIASANQVRMAGRVLDVLNATSHELRVRITPGGSGPLEVSVAGSGEARSGDPYVVTTPPMVVTYSPIRVTVGSEVTIRGSRFGSDPLAIKVTLGDVAQELVSVRDDVVVVRIVPGSQSASLAVTTALQGTTTIEPDLVVLPTLVVQRALPLRARAGASIEVRGTGFEAGAVVVLGQQVIEPESITSDRLRFVFPADAPGGLLTVRLRDGREATAPLPVSVAP